MEMIGGREAIIGGKTGLRVIGAIILGAIAPRKMIGARITGEKISRKTTPKTKRRTRHVRETTVATS